MMKKKYILFVTIIISLFSCEKPIDFDLNNQENSRLVVEGSVTNQTKAHTIKLTRTSSYYENQPAPKEVGATVTIFDGTSIHTLSEISDGIYQTATTYKGEVGKTYTLNITTNNDNFYTASSNLVAVATIDTVLFNVDTDFDDEEVLILEHYGPEPNEEGNNYMWLVDINGINYTEDIATTMFVTDEHVNGNYIDGFEFQEILLEELPNTDTLKVTVEMHSISRKYYDFLVAIALETEFNGDLFSGPPANIPSNISNGGLGFFIASAVTTEYIEISTP
ncbi:MAG: DUF4249 domain-containing protein [Flavobacteriales bacterium]|nr:DUF4249 domain-containing protein [Flavobacteriales bacterium]